MSNFEIQRIKRKALVICKDGTYTITGDEKYIDSEIKRLKGKFGIK